MYPLAALSIVGLTLVFERCWFWLGTNSPGKAAKLEETARNLRAGRLDETKQLITGDRSVYAKMTSAVLEEPGVEEAASAAAQSQLPRMERFMPTLGTIITAAPMLGILGTVTGIIRVANVFTENSTVTDPAAVLPGIGEALLTTVAGLIIALVVLLPFNAFRAQIDRSLGRMEMLGAAARAGYRVRWGDKNNPDNEPPDTNS